VDGELNDVRAPRSEKLKFWVSFHTDNRQSLLLSLLVLVGFRQIICKYVTINNAFDKNYISV